jgi:hypothetical protein
MPLPQPSLLHGAIGAVNMPPPPPPPLSKKMRSQQKRRKRRVSKEWLESVGSLRWSIGDEREHISVRIHKGWGTLSFQAKT